MKLEKLPKLTPEEVAACKRHGSYSQYLERVQECKTLRAELVDVQVGLNFAVARFQKAEAELKRLRAKLRQRQGKVLALGEWCERVGFLSSHVARGCPCGRSHRRVEVREVKPEKGGGA